MVEDELPKNLGYYLVTVLDLDTYKYSTTIARWDRYTFNNLDEAPVKNSCVIAWLPKDANPAPLVPTFNCDECDHLLQCEKQCVEEWKKYLLSDIDIRDFLFGTAPCEPVKEGGEE